MTPGQPRYLKPFTENVVSGWTLHFSKSFWKIERFFKLFLVGMGSPKSANVGFLERHVTSFHAYHKFSGKKTNLMFWVDTKAGLWQTSLAKCNGFFDASPQLFTATHTLLAHFSALYRGI